MIKKSYVVCFILLIPVLAKSQILNPTNYSSFGLFTDYNYISNDADFKNLPGNYDCCPEFKSASGSGYSIGGRYTYTFSDFGLELRAGINHGEGTFVSSKWGIFGFTQNAILKVNDKYILNYNYTNLGLDVHGFYYITDRFSISAGFGTLFFFNSDYNQHEEMVVPQGFAFISDSVEKVVGQFTRHEHKGVIPSLNTVQFYAGARIGYELPITPDHAWVLKPELEFNYNFNNMIQYYSWNTSKLELGFSLFYTLGKTVVPSEETVKKLQKELARSYEENKNLKIEKEKTISSMQEKLDSQKATNITLNQSLKEKETILRQDSIKKEQEKQQLAEQMEEANKQIDSENAEALKGCSCYVILYSSSVDKEKAENVLSVLKKYGIEDAKIIIFNDPYLKTRFYRVQSQCFDDFNDAFDELTQFRNKIETSNITAQIKCGK